MNMIFVRSTALYLLLFYLGNVTGADSCDGHQKGKGGKISFPEIASDYPPNTDCTWYVDAPYNADSIHVTFSRFDINDMKTPNYTTNRGECDDYLQIFNADNYRVMNRCDKPFNGQQDLFKTEIKGNTMKVHFHSDNVNTGKGFSLTWAVNKWRSTTTPPITTRSTTTAAVVTTKKTTTQPTTTKTTATIKRPTTTKTTTKTKRPTTTKTTTTTKRPTTTNRPTTTKSTTTTKRPTTTKTTTTTKRPTKTKPTTTTKRPTTTKTTTTTKRPTTTKTTATSKRPTTTKTTTNTKRPTTTKTAAKKTQPTTTKPTTTTKRPTTKTAATTTQPTTTKSTETTAQLTTAKTTATTTQPTTTKNAATTKRPPTTKSRETTKLPTKNKSTTTFTKESIVTSKDNVTIGEETLDIDPSSDIIIYVSAFLAIETCLSVVACVLWRSRRRRRNVAEAESCSEDNKRSGEFVSNLHMPQQRSSMSDDSVKEFGVLTTAHEYEEIPLGNMLNSIENEDLYIDNESQYDVLRQPRQTKTNQKTNNIYGHLVL